MEKLIQLLQTTEGVSAYEILRCDKEQAELYYVGKKLETNRAVEETSTTVRVYNDFDEYRGDSSFEILASDDEGSIEEKLLETIERAKAVKNKWYPLVETKENINEEYPLEKPLNEIATDIADAIFAGDHYQDGQLNATEIFVSLEHKTFINSLGVEHHYDHFGASYETIPTWKGEKEEVELYDFQRLETIDKEAISKHIEEVLGFAQKRAAAKTLNEVEVDENIPVVVQSEMVDVLTAQLVYDASYSNHYFKMNQINQDQAVSQTPFNITLKGVETGLTGSQVVDQNGVILGEKEIFHDGKLVGLWGGNRYGYYLNEEEVTGNLNCALVDGPRSDEGEIFKEKHLIVCNFSAPQLDWNSGYFGGEIRLALYFDGQQYIPLTGFSISGNIFESLQTVRFSTENEIVNEFISYSGPKYWIFEGMTFN